MILVIVFVIRPKLEIHVSKHFADHKFHAAVSDRNLLV